VAETYFGTCSLCEACCGVEIEHEGPAILSIKGDQSDPLSNGHICPKAISLQDLHNDPDRLRTPMIKRQGRFEECSWDQAFEHIGRRLSEIEGAHGRNAIALYYGNPTIHNYATVFYLLRLFDNLGSQNVFSANSVDTLPRLLTSSLLYGNLAVIPVPDIDRTDFMLIMGANPVVSNGSVMTAPGVKTRLQNIQKRGGKVVVIDPRRSETAKLADQHYFIRPGSDALLLAAMLHTIFTEKRCKVDKILTLLDGFDELKSLFAPYSPKKVAPKVGLSAESIQELARQFSSAKTAVCYGRVGTCIQQFGSIATWFIDLLNIVTGNLDQAGGAMFTRPPLDLARLLRWSNMAGHFGRWKTRVRGLPEFNGEVPMAALAEEIESPGPGQIRALMTLAGNPVLSNANGRRMDKALEQLDFMVSIDLYLNETTRHADVLLPSTSPLEHDHFALLFQLVTVRNNIHYSPALFEKPKDALQDWQILLRLQSEILKRRGPLSRIRGWLSGKVLNWIGPKRMLDFLLRIGPYKTSIKKQLKQPHGVDHGPLQSRLPEILDSPDKKIQLIPPVYKEGLGQLTKALQQSDSEETLQLISRRILHSNNSWMHNCERLMKGKDACVLLIHPDDAKKRRIAAGSLTRVSSPVGAVEVEAELSTDMMVGVVCLPHGWGHHRDGSQLSIASRHPGVSINDLTDDGFIDQVSGTSALNGIAVTVVLATAKVEV
jgi:anaerobic selenocysteine-containing dehydrogenase